MSSDAWRDPEEIRQTHATLRRLAAQLVALPEDADDVVQETWLAVLMQRAAIRNRAGWFQSVVRYQALRRRRREALRREHEARAVALQCVSAHELEPAAARLRRAVVALREPYRSVVRLRFEDELSCEVIAQRLGRPLKTVKSQLNRALKQIRARLQEPEDTHSRSIRGGWMFPLGTRSAPVKVLVWVGVGAAAVGLLLLVPFERETRDRAGPRTELETAKSGASSLLPVKGDAPLGERTRARTEPQPGTSAIVAPRSQHVGVVRNAEGQAASGARVWAARRGAAQDAVQVATADAEGRFRLPSLAPDTYVTADGNGWLALGWAEAPTSSGPDDAPLTLRVHATQNRVLGTVRDEGGAPISGARIDRLEPDTTPWVDGVLGWRIPGGAPGPRTDREGAFELDVHHHFAQGLVVTADGYAPALVGVRSEGRGTIPLEIVLARGETLAGRVLLPSGASAAGACVEFQPDAPLPVASTIARSDGEFELLHLAHGEGTLVVRGAGSAQGLSYRARLEFPTLAPVRVTLTGQWTIRGTAVDSSGAPCAGWSVVARRARELGARLERLDPWRGSGPGAQTDARGQFVVAGLELAAHRVYLVAPGESVERASALVPWPTASEHVALVAAGELARLEGRLAFDASRAGERTLILRSPVLLHDRVARVDEPAGTFAFEGLLPGEYELFLWDPAGPPWHLASPLVTAGRCDAGVLAPPQEGSLALRIRGPVGPVNPDVVRLRALEGYGLVHSLPQMSREGPGEVTTGSLPPGRYQLHVKVRGIAERVIEVGIESPRKPLEVLLEPGTLVVVVLRAPREFETGSEVVLDLEGPTGFAACRRAVSPRAVPVKYPWIVTPGDYRLRATGAHGGTASVHFTISDEDETEVYLELRDDGPRAATEETSGSRSR